MKFKFSSVILLILFVAIFFGCKPSQKVEATKFEVTTNLYEPAIYFTDTSTELKSPLEIAFSSSVAPINYSEQDLSNLITISPVINGTWSWVNDSYLKFVPKENWSLGTKYKINFNTKLFSDNVIVDSSCSFKTLDYKLSMTDAEFFIDPENTSIKRVTFSLEGTAPFDTENISKKISLKLKSGKKDKSSSNSNKVESIEKNYNFKISYNENKTIAYVVSEPIPMPQYTSEMNIVVDSGIKSLFGGAPSSKLTDSVTVPGISDYVNIQNVSHSLIKNDKQNYDQIIFVETKGMVSAEELEKYISVYELPDDRPKEQGHKEIKNYDWYDTTYVTDLVLSQSKKIDFTMIPTAEKNTSVNSFKIKTTPQKYIYVKIAGNINFYGGYKWDDVYEKTLRVKSYPKELGILSEGTILSLSGSKKMSLYSRGVNRVEYSISRIMPKDINHLVAMSNGDMKNFKFSNYRFDEDNISEKTTSKYYIPGANLETVSYFSYDFSKQLNSVPEKNLKNGLFIFSVEDDSNSRLKDKRLILVTDLGFFVKQNSNRTKDIFVQSISTGNPVGNARVCVLGINGNPVYETFTNSLGHATISDLFGLENEHEPIAYIVEKANDLSFMPYSANGRRLDYSNFDVGGVYGSSDPEKINAYLFNDRGIYRPGEEINVGMILKSGDWNNNLYNIPLELAVVDSKGTEMFTKQFSNSASGFNEVSFSTKQYSPTGKYTVTLYLLKEENERIKRNYLASNSLSVEEFLPDTLTLQTGFEPLPNSGWIDTDELIGTVSLRNLFGTPASGNEVRGQITLTPGFPSVKKYSDYNFSDPYLKENSYDEFLGETKTNDEGKANFKINLEKFEKATYQLTFYVEAFEKDSGRNVSKQSQVIVSPLKYMIGYKADGSLSYVNNDSVRKISLIAIDKNLEKISLENITLNIEEQKYVSSLVKQPNGLYKYQSVKKEYPVSSQKISITKDGYDFVVPTNIEGEFTVSLVNEEGLVFNKINYSVVGDKNITRSITRNAELEITLEDSDLSVGETAKLFIKSPYPGSGLITIERDKVYSYKWFNTSELSSIQTIDIPFGIEGNGYINVMFTRSSTSEEIFMSPFCYGTVPFSVNKDNRTNKIKLDVPSEIKSGEEFTINYSTSEKGKIVVFAVDEGILQVGRYSTPDPLSFFFQKKALEVGTLQILDLVLPDYNVLKSVSAFGGGAGMDMLKSNLNPFSRKVNKPVAFWSGILDADKTTRSVKYKVPDYFNGSIRVMAVAVSPDTVGAAQTSTIATNAFIMIPNNPLVAAPGDEFDVSVTVTNNFKGSGEEAEITINLENTEHLSVLTDKTVKVKIPEGKDEVVRFVVKAENKLGGAELKFIATGKNLSGVEEKTVYTSTLSVRPSIPYQVWIESGLTKSKSAKLNVEHKTYDEYAQRTASVSNMPTTFVDGLKFYLEKYPYGCSEQVVSKTYPYIYRDVAKVAGITQEKVNGMVEETISILQSRLKPDGNIGYWTNKSPTQDIITLYAAEFLTDAKNHGFSVPSTFMSKVLKAVEVIASDAEEKREAHIRSYAIYILTKNEEVTTHYIEDLEKDLSIFDSSSEYEKLYLAASYKMMMQEEKANKLYNAAKFDMMFDSSWDYQNELHYNSTYIDIVSTYFPEKVKHITKEQVESFCNRLKFNFFNSFSTSAAYKALYSYSKLISAENNPYEIYQLINNEEKKLPFESESENVKSQYAKKSNFDSDAEKIIFKNDSELLMYYQTVEGGYETSIPTKPVDDGIEVFREFCKPDGSKLSDIKIGDTVMVKINIRSSKEGYLNNVAVIDLSCAGLESDIESIRTSDSMWKPDYIDIREDRVVLYGTVTDRINSFTYLAKAISTGTFVVPPLYAESMYNGEIKGIGPQSPIKISK